MDGNIWRKKALVVERFDRRLLDNGTILRLPQEDMCQALGYASTQKYQDRGGPALVDILELLKASDTPDKDIETVFLCQALFWLICANDGHAKNFSVFLGRSNQFRLTPIYDVLSAQPDFDDRNILHKDYRLAMSVGRKPHYKINRIRGYHFLESAVAARLPESFARGVLCIFDDGWFDMAFEAVLLDLPDNFPMDIHESIKAGATQGLNYLQSVFG